MKRWLGGGLTLASLITVVGWPVTALVWRAILDLQESPDGGIASARPLRLALETLKLVGLTELMALPLGVALGWLLFRTDLWGRRPLLFIIGVALFVPMPLHAVAWLGSYGNAGRLQALGGAPLLVGMRGAAFVHGMASLPWVILLSGVGLRTVEPELEELALMDWPAWRVWLGISLRRSIGAIAGAAAAVAVLTAGDMTVTDLLQIRTYAEESYLQAQLGLGQGAAGLRVTLPMLAVLGVAIFWSARALLAADPARLPSATSRSRRWQLSVWRVPLGVLMLVLIGNAIALPLYGLIWRAGFVGATRHWSPGGLFGSLHAALPDLVASTMPGPWYQTLDSRPLVATAMWGCLSAAISVAIAWSVAWRSREPGIWRTIAVVTAVILLATPGPVVGVALKTAYLMVPSVHDTPAILVLAYVARTLPYAFLVLWPAVRLLPKEYLETAELDGLGPWGQFLRVGLPLTTGAIVAAWGVAFVLAMGELPTSYFVAPPGRDPVALWVWRLLHTGVESRLAAIGLMLIAVTTAVGAVAVWLIDRGYRIES